MNEKYIFYPNIDLDLEKIKEIVIRNMNLKVPNLATHQRKIENEPYLLELRKKYNFLSTMYNIYTTGPSYVTPIHICPNRGCALNIPIIYTEDSHTIFYELKGDVVKHYSKERVYEIIESDTIEVFRYTLDRPVIMNTQLPHGVIGGPDKPRTIMSWSIDLKHDYETVKRIIGSVK